jgi:hypothetical protein
MHAYFKSWKSQVQISARVPPIARSLTIFLKFCMQIKGQPQPLTATFFRFHSSSSFYLSIYLSIYLWLYSPLLGLGRFFNFLFFYTISRTPWAEISPSQDLYLHTRQHKHGINAHRHPCLEWNSTQDPSVRAGEDSSCLRRLGHCDRQTHHSAAGNLCYWQRR